MQRRCGIFTVAVVSFAAAACSASKPAEVKDTASPFRITASIKDIMDSVVDPAADVLWDSVSTTISRTGTEEKMPRTDDDWKLVRRNAVVLIEATNLLAMDGRRVANPGDKSEYPGIELGPEEIQKLLDADRTAWLKYAHTLHDATMVALKAIDSKNVRGLLDAGEGIDEACENCHKHYWYPEQKPS